ncbi:CotO family spore coat protein [Ectobacillus ponti]|uniref:Spore coat CotO family protein n=1 Tax=Ectobacillus ponti TaxID=2961894 RepID=A0AA41X8J9_9BACI|nr:CotO family spore coat protein [Ectobacillus ponti]MCP8968355.1 spore coat CotO family protein [Ectobacillus ponti]
MSKKKQADTERSPLFYIAQPQLQRPVAPMQHSFVIKKGKPAGNGKKETAEIEAGTAEAREQEPAAWAENPSAAHTAVQQEEEHGEDIAADDAVMRKPFKDMSIEEKIQYVLHLPHYIPKIPCEVMTNGQKHLGYIRSYKEETEMVKLQLQNQLSSVEIPLREIQSIQMRGLY